MYVYRKMLSLFVFSILKFVYKLHIEETGYRKFKKYIILRNNCNIFLLNPICVTYNLLVFCLDF